LPLSERQSEFPYSISPTLVAGVLRSVRYGFSDPDGGLTREG
jgi:hypothetical protein